MTSLDELRRTLEQRADLAPDAVGLVEQARAGAVRLRRRNRFRAVAAAVVAVAVAVGVPYAARLNPSEPAPNPAGPMTYYREPFQLTLDLAPGPVYFTLTHGTQGRTQFLVARPIGTPKDDSGGTIAAHDPGTFDPTRLRRGERVTVHGHPAFYVQNLDPPAPSEPAGTNASGPDSSYRIGAAVGWQDPSGAWVTVSDGASRAAMLRLAESVRLTSPRTARAPVRFGWVPLDLPVTYTESRDVAAHGVSANIGFGGPAEPSGQPSSPFFAMPYDTPLSVSVLPMEGIMTAWGEDYADRPMRVIAGHRTWYIEGDAGPLASRDGSHMLIQAGSCGITIAVRDRASIPSAALERMVENMTFGGCDDTSDWLPIVGS
uniref:hypothetical protein n=1 Tax=Paractinoplanes polyasparticus TaxID=2856853 RepID=UPI001C85B869|nr:hypothetical protein [Actinoplanes polyasparticus]